VLGGKGEPKRGQEGEAKRNVNKKKGGRKKEETKGRE